jgi:agmatinase
MTSLRSGPLPRMSGDLTFMRSTRGRVEDLNCNSLAVVGIPMEENTGLDVGCRMTPQAIRETSVYFGWHANPQFSHPVDVDVRKQISTSSIHERMIDVGDIPVEGLSSLAASNAIEESIRAIRNRGAASIVLSGDSRAVKTIVRTQSKNETLGFVQIGGRTPPSLLEADKTGQSFVGDMVSEGMLEPSNIAIIAPARAPTREGAQQLRDRGSYLFSAAQVMSAPPHQLRSVFQTIAQEVDSLIVNLDLSAVASPLHGMSPIRRIDGVSVSKLQALLTDVGQTPVSTLIVSGMNPTVNGMSIVKTGQRLLMTALLGYIYGRLGILKSLQREEVEHAIER